MKDRSEHVRSRGEKVDVSVDLKDPPGIVAASEPRQLVGGEAKLWN